MANEKKATEKKEHPDHYEERLVVKGSFMDIIKMINVLLSKPNPNAPVKVSKSR